jgi:CO/xanthine dehydrogenase FAD-binding subunit
MRGSKDKAFVIAGGTSLGFMKSSRDNKIAINISKLPLRFVSKEGKGFRIGALSTIDDLMKYNEEGWALGKVAVKMSAQQIRNVSTLGGNIARLFYWSDFPVSLLVLDGVIAITGEREKTIPAEAFFKKQPVNMLAEESSLITSVEIKSVAKDAGFGYHKETRTSPAFSSLTAAAFLKTHKGVISDARVAVSACVHMPQRLYDIERQLVGMKAEPNELKKLVLSEIDNLFFIPKEGMTEEYCRNLAKVRVVDVITEAVIEATGRKN